MDVVAVDIGGTHVRFAIAKVADGRVVSLGEPATLKTAEYASLQTAWQAFGASLDSPLPRAAAIAVASPVGGELIKLTNNPWIIRPALVRERLEVDDYVLINDFGAVGHATAQMPEDCFLHLGGPDEPFAAQGVLTVCGPGTGLGVAQVLRTPHGYHVIETEGGHVDFAPLDNLEDRMLEYLRRSLRRVSVERIVAGSGLPNIYRALAAFEGKRVADLDDVDLWNAAIDGADPLAVVALDRFFLSLGAVAGDLALAHGANAAVIAGGLGFRLKDKFATSGFADRFIAKGRFERRMDDMPVKLITYPEPGLFGAAAAFAKDHG